MTHVFALWVHDATDAICRDPYGTRRDLRHREWFWDCQTCRTTRPARDEATARAAEARHECGRRVPEPEPAQRRWSAKPWTATEDELVRTLSPVDAARATGRTRTAVQKRRTALAVPYLRQPWTDAEIATLIQHGPSETAARTGHTRASCATKLRNLRSQGLAP